MVKMKITGAVSNGNTLQFAAKRAAAPPVRRRMEQVGNANSLMAADFDLARPNERRRHPGSRRAATALDYAVTGNVDRLELGFRVLGGDVVFRRILGMNFGTPAHRIYPSGAWGLSGVGEWNRMIGSGRVTRTRQPMLAWTEEGTSVVVPEADHPGTSGSGFLEEARDVAADALRARISP
jgi:hypothetical protein